MKKFRLESVKKRQSDVQKEKAKQESVKIDSRKVLDVKQQSQKQKKKSKIQKQIELLTEKIAQSNTNIKQTEKLLDIDLFLKTQKEKRLEYGRKLNQQYENSKKQRQTKLYKQNNRNEQSQKLITNPIKSEIPLSIFSALDQIKLTSNPIRSWILDEHHYKLNDMLLDKTKDNLLGQNMRNQEENNLKQNKQNSWKKSRQISNNCAQMTFFPVKIEQNQLEPSDKGEALMSALTIMPPALSQHLYSQATDIHKQKYFLLRFYPGGERKSVFTDQNIEVRQFTHRYINVNSRTKNNQSFWSSIMQKAVNKLYFMQTCPSNLIQTIQLLYGLDPQIIPFNKSIVIKQNFAKIMDSLLKFQPKALIGFLNDRVQTSNRIYPLLGVEEPAVVSVAVKKKNKNKKEIVEEEKEVPQKKEILYHISNPYSGSLLASNFVNKFTLEELSQKFNKIVILRQLPPRWAGVRINVEFMSNGPITFTGADWVKNNQYSFTLTRSVAARVALRRKWGSFVEGQGRDEQKNVFGFVLFKSQQGETEISCMKLQGLIYKCKSTDEEGCIYNGVLQKGTYIMIPYSHRVSQQYMQLFNFDVLVEREDAIAVNKSKMNEYFYQNNEAGNSKILQKLESKVKYEKPRLQKIVIPKLFYEVGVKSVTVGYVQGLGLTLMKGASNEDYFSPGKIKALLVSGQMKQQKKEKAVVRSAQQQQIQKYEKEQALRVLLGYDVLMDEDINYGQMKSIIEETSDEIDLSNFGLGQEGLMAVIQALMQLPRIVKLNLADNDLNDSIITYVCYYLEKGGRNQLRQLNLSGNPIGKTGNKALKGLCNIFKQLKVIGLKS